MCVCVCVCVCVCLCVRGMDQDCLVSFFSDFVFIYLFLFASCEKSRTKVIEIIRYFNLIPT